MNETETAALLKEARRAWKNAYAPYSDFPVGAAILGESGRIYSGCNVECCTYGLTVCAERNAAACGVCRGETRFSGLVIYTDTAKPVVPCGACRQVLAEFNPGLPIISRTARGSVSMNLDEIFPSPFSRGHLLPGR